MKNIFSRHVFILCIKIVIAAIFIYAGTQKMLDPQAFADSIYSFDLLPSALINGFALGLPPFEIVIGILLLIGNKKEEARLAIMALSLIFAFALIQALIRGLEVDCGCFGSGKPSLLKTWLSLGRDLLIWCGAWFIGDQSKSAKVMGL